MIELAANTLGEEERNAVAEVMSSGRLAMSYRVNDFEADFAAYVGSKHAVMVNSGSSANLIALAALKGSKGGEIIVPALTWSTTVWPVVQAGYVPVFVDCDPDTLCMDTDEVESAITEKTVAVFCAHIMGNACNLDGLLRICTTQGLTLIEDCCEATGARYDGEHVGTLGTLGTFSFFMSHHMTTIEGGMVITDFSELAKRAQSMRSHGWARGERSDFQGRFWFTNPGYNVRPTEINAAIGIEQLKKLDNMNKRRKEIAETMWKMLSPFDELRLMTPTEKVDCSWFAFPVILKRGSRDGFASHLEAHDIHTRPIVAGNLTRHPAFQNIGRVHGNLENASEVMDRGLYWGCHQDVTSDDIEKLAWATRKYFKVAA